MKSMINAFITIGAFLAIVTNVISWTRADFYEKLYERHEAVCPFNRDTVSLVVNLAYGGFKTIPIRGHFMKGALDREMPKGAPVYFWEYEK